MITEPIVFEELAGLLAQVREDRLCSLSEAAAWLEVEPPELRRWIVDGLVPAEKIAGRFVIRFADLVQWFVGGQVIARTPPEVLDLPA